MIPSLVKIIGDEAYNVKVESEDEENIKLITLRDTIKFMFLYTRHTFDFGEKEDDEAYEVGEESRDLNYYIVKNRNNSKMINVLYFLVRISETLLENNEQYQA